MSAIVLVLQSRPRDLGGFAVRRALPAAERGMVGPFVFFDHFGPSTFAPGEPAVQVRPHPHIGLATITYLFEGVIVHRDHLGNVQAIQPGDVNWMVAGRGIVHSERTPPEERARGARVHGLQTWVALPGGEEEREPHFEHHDGGSVPVVRRPGATLRVVAGTAYGASAAAGVLSPTLYVHAELDAGATIDVDDQHPERAIYVVSGGVTVDGRGLDAGSMAVLAGGAHVTVSAREASHVMLVGGAPVGARHVEWNFVSSSKERIARAKADWREGRFGKIPTDAVEFIPLPDG